MSVKLIICWWKKFLSLVCFDVSMFYYGVHAFVMRMKWYSIIQRFETLLLLLLRQKEYAITRILKIELKKMWTYGIATYERYVWNSAIFQCTNDWWIMIIILIEAVKIFIVSKHIDKFTFTIRTFVLIVDQTPHYSG